jgi:hypothetical protein
VAAAPQAGRLTTPAAHQRDEPADLADGLPLQAVDRGEHVRVDDLAARVGEDVVQAALHVGDQPVGGAAGAGLLQDRHLVGELEADQGQGGVGQGGQRKQPTATGPASEVPYMLATGAQNASARARRASGRRGSLVLVIRRGRIRRRPQEAGVGGRPLPPAEHEDRPAAGGAARGRDVDLVEQVGVGLQPGQVALDQVEGEPPVGDHLVPVGHEVVLGHRGQAGQVAQPLAAPGRRRRSYRITPEGRAALSARLAEPAAEPPQLRSLGLLKLFFAQHAGPGDIAELARVQAELHRQAVDSAREIVARVQARGDLPGQLAVAELMGDALRVMGEHWERIGRALAEPPGPAAAAGGR